MGLVDQKHEAFAHSVAAGHSLSESARRAGFSKSSAHNSGSRLAKRPDVRARINELLSAQAAENAGPGVASREWIISEVIETHRLAREEANHAVSKQCLELLAKLQGHLAERKQAPNAAEVNWWALTIPQLEELLRQRPEVSEGQRELLKETLELEPVRV